MFVENHDGVGRLVCDIRGRVANPSGSSQM